MLSVSVAATLLATTLFSTAHAVAISTTSTPQQSKPQVVAYWGQAANQPALETFCQDSSIDVIPIGFVNKYPNQDAGSYGLPGMNFGNACWATEYYVDAQGHTTEAFDRCHGLIDDVPTCQAAGKKILISIGGDSPLTDFASDTDAEAFATQLWQMFGPMQPGYTGPRPMGDAEVDGFDFDIESGTGAHLPAAISTLRSLAGSGKIISAAPQCSVPDAHMGDLIANADIDYLFVQFYNTPACSARSAVNAGYTTSNWDAWASLAPSHNKNAKVFFGLPGGPDGISAANANDVLSVAEATTLIEKYYCSDQYKSAFGGVMLFDAPAAANNGNYAQSMQAALSQCSCFPTPVTTTTTTLSTVSTTSALVTTTTTTWQSTSTTSTPVTSTTTSSSSSSSRSPSTSATLSPSSTLSSASTTSATISPASSSLSSSIGSSTLVASSASSTSTLTTVSPISTSPTASTPYLPTTSSHSLTISSSGSSSTSTSTSASSWVWTTTSSSAATSAASTTSSSEVSPVSNTSSTIAITSNSITSPIVTSPGSFHTTPVSKTSSISASSISSSTSKVTSTSSDNIQPVSSTSSQYWGDWSSTTSVDIQPVSSTSSQYWGDWSSTTSVDIQPVSSTSSQYWGDWSSTTSVDIQPVSSTSSQYWGDWSSTTSVDIQPVSSTSSQYWGDWSSTESVPVLTETVVPVSTTLPAKITFATVTAGAGSSIVTASGKLGAKSSASSAVAAQGTSTAAAPVWSAAWGSKASSAVAPVNTASVVAASGSPSNAWGAVPSATFTPLNVSPFTGDAGKELPGMVMSVAVCVFVAIGGLFL